MAQPNTPKPMKEVNLFVPLNHNGQEAVSPDALRSVEDLVTDRFGGCTLHPSLLGGWIDRVGVRFHDTIMIIEVMIEDCPNLLELLVEIGDFILKRFQQDEVFITIRDVGVLSVNSYPSRDAGLGAPSLLTHKRALSGNRPRDVERFDMGQWEDYDTLTNREYEVLLLLVHAKRNSEIAQELGITEGVVEIHLNRIYQKLGVKSRTEAAVYALRNGLAD